MRYQFIDQQTKHHSVNALCSCLKVSKSAFYAWKIRPESTRKQAGNRLKAKIIDIHDKSRKSYGRPRILAELTGESCSPKRVARLMKEAGIVSKHEKKYKATTNSKHDEPISPNLLDRKFNPENENKACVSDLTYVWTKEGVALFSGDNGFIFQACDRLVDGQQYESRADHKSAGNTCKHKRN